jgi:hypothetical protein
MLQLNIISLEIIFNVYNKLEFLATDPEARARFQALPDFLKKKKKRKQ